MSGVPTAPEREPSFLRSLAVYTGSRIAVFAVLLGLLYGVGVRGLIVVLIALVLSGILSYFLLDRQRADFAVALERRMQRRRAASAARAAREDAVADALIAEEERRRSAAASGAGQ